MRRRLSRLFAAACLATSAVVAFLPAPSSAEAPQATGWWSRRFPLEGEGQVEGQSARQPVMFTKAGTPRQVPPEVTVPGVGEPGSPVTTTPLPVPIPTVPDLPIPIPEDPGPGTPNPSVPEGGLWVANDPTGPAAISAIRYRGDIGEAELTLKFAPGGTIIGPVVACPALSGFEPGPAGAWRDRPAHDCKRMALSGRTLPDGSGLQFTIPQGFAPFGERVIDIIILPATNSGDPFSLYFEKPGEDSLVVTAGQELPAPVAELPEPDPLTLPETPTEFSSDFDDAGFVDAPVEIPEEEAAAPSGGEEAAGPKPIAEFLEPFTESRTGRIISVLVLLAMGAGLWLFGGQPIRHPKLLGAMAGDVPALIDPPEETGRGIGRFRRQRISPPNRL